MDSYYKELGVDESASQADIKKAYRRMAQKYHPDREGGNVKKFNAAKEAYDALSGKNVANGNRGTRDSYRQEFNEVAAVNLNEWATHFRKALKKRLSFGQRIMFNFSASRKFSPLFLSRYLRSGAAFDLDMEEWLTVSVSAQKKRKIEGFTNTSEVAFKSSDTKERYITEDGAAMLMAVALNKGAKERFINLQIDALKKCKKHTFSNL